MKVKDSSEHPQIQELERKIELLEKENKELKKTQINNNNENNSDFQHNLLMSGMLY